ncbi:unnamed protein product [Pelagomonas calceolata]|uniref:Uncharacterized protein n=1 Tax=Pelagomonas calceolata TaxID=35677 RepID=A0A8J2T2N7_9STRA|nr:unnamed protein product [Pelagomonas calceolata]|mmetsp:Transcript_10407/g.30615  ORF Transcript_10407/g.30615 Transcript_10407/m.30615 type:complete len:820 (+) Transcript_10407:194-2653(+)
MALSESQLAKLEGAIARMVEDDDAQSSVLDKGWLRKKLEEDTASDEEEADDLDDLQKTGGRWRILVSVWGPAAQKWGAKLIRFKRIIYIMKQYGPGSCVPLAFMYKHHVGYFIKFASDEALAPFVPTFPPGAAADDPVDREDGFDLGEVSAEVVASAAINLQRAKYGEGPKGLMARLLCVCLAAENEGRGFGTYTGGEWILGQLAGIVPYENCDCFEWLHEKSHGDVLAKLFEELFGTRLAPHDARMLGANTELKARFPNDDGQFTDSGSGQVMYISIGGGRKKSGYANLRERLRAHDGRLLLLARTYLGNNRARQSAALGNPLADACDDLTYYNDGDQPRIVHARPPSSRTRPDERCVIVRQPGDATPRSIPWDPDRDPLYIHQARRGLFVWHESMGTTTFRKIPKCKLDTAKLYLCCQKNSWGSNIEGTPAELDAATGRQILDLLQASGEKESYLTSMARATATVNGKDGRRLTYNTGMLTVAQILGAEAFRLVTECKEHMVILLADGRRIIITTATCTAANSGDNSICQFSIESNGRHPLLWRQTAVCVLVIKFPSDTYEFCEGNQYCRRLSVATPRDRKLFCVFSTDLSLELREKVMKIYVPKNLMYEKLLAVQGMRPDARYLSKPRLDPAWKGGDDLYRVFQNGLVDSSELLDKVREVGAPWADWLDAASVLGPGLDLDALCARLPPATHADVRRAFGVETLATAPPQPSALERTIAGDLGAAREHLAHHSQATRPAPPPNLGAAAPVVAGRPVPRSGFENDGPLGPSFTTPMFRALPNAPYKPQGPGGYRPQDDSSAPVHHFTFSDSDDEEEW